jgi:uncharacterized lipoprotein YddW (UPF0748 family)
MSLAEPRTRASSAPIDVFLPLRLFGFVFLAACSSATTVPSPDGGPPPVAREMRGVWIATVRNIDWPSSDRLSPDNQRSELVDILERAKAAGLNAVFFQVRPAADALYESDLEPWSKYLSGRQGVDPGYDPLAFAIEQAHARGLELHAWINPFRAGRDARDTNALAPSHQWNTKRHLVKVYGDQLWLDPGEPEAFEHSLAVVKDLVRRYDVDGIHMDDYFYPYPVRDSALGGNLAFPDDGSYGRSGSRLPLDDWRRDNIDRFVRRMYIESHAIKPQMKVSISPFGIWRPNNPPGSCCFDQYGLLYADARKWLREGWVDFFVPQLYWPIAAPQQRFEQLLDWWIAESVQGRYVWPGLATYRAAALSNNFAHDEVARQVALTRSRAMAPGHVHFNATTTLKRDNGVLATLTPLYAHPALVPAMTWLPASPDLRPRFWVVQSHFGGGLFRRARWTTRIISGDSTATGEAGAQRVFARPVDRAGRVGAPTLLP